MEDGDQTPGVTRAPAQPISLGPWEFVRPGGEACLCGVSAPLERVPVLPKLGLRTLARDQSQCPSTPCCSSGQGTGWLNFFVGGYSCFEALPAGAELCVQSPGWQLSFPKAPPSPVGSPVLDWALLCFHPVRWKQIRTIHRLPGQPLTISLSFQLLVQLLTFAGSLVHHVSLLCLDKVIAHRSKAS